MKIITWNVNGIRSRIFNDQISSKLKKNEPICPQDNSPISDLDLIFGIAKIFDPTSVVRGSEVNAVNEIGGLPQIVYKSVGRLQGKQQLSNETRRQIVDAGTRRIKTYEKSYGIRVRKTKAIADRYKFDYSLVGLTDDDTRFFPVTYKFGD